MFIRFLIMSVFALLMAGCTTFEQIDRNIETKYVGQPIGRVINMIGYPSREMTIAGRKLYIWESQRDFTLTLPKTTNAYGYIGSSPISVTSYGTESSHYHYYCTLKLEVDKNDIVTRYSYEGNLGGCERYAN